MLLAAFDSFIKNACYDLDHYHLLETDHMYVTF